MKTLNISNLCFSYENGIEKHAIFQNSSLSLEDSRIIGLVGVNGCGKSTLLKLIKGDLIAQKGTITVCETNASEISNISFITQQPIDNIFQNSQFLKIICYFMRENLFLLTDLIK